MDPQIGQWRNIDPHATKYANASPYSYTENNPIERIDPTGKDWVISTSTDENGNITKHITFTGAILNSGSTSAGDVAKFKTAGESQLKNAYTQSYPQTITVPQTVNVFGATQEVSVTKAIQVNVSIDVNLRVSYQQTTLKHTSPGNYVNINQIHILQANYNNGKLNQNNIPK